MRRGRDISSRRTYVFLLFYPFLSKILYPLPQASLAVAVILAREDIPHSLQITESVAHVR